MRSRTQLGQPPPLLHISLTICWHAFKGIEARGGGGSGAFLNARVGVEDGIERSFMETGAEGKETRHSSFFTRDEWLWRGRFVKLLQKMVRLEVHGRSVPRRFATRASVRSVAVVE